MHIGLDPPSGSGATRPLLVLAVALKAQSRCRTTIETIETLAILKNPRQRPSRGGSTLLSARNGLPTAGTQILNPLPEHRRRSALPRLPLIDDGFACRSNPLGERRLRES